MKLDRLPIVCGIPVRKFNSSRDQPLTNEIGHSIPCRCELQEVRVSWWVHVGTVSCAIDEHRLHSTPQVTSDAEGMPRVNRTIGKHNVGSGHILASIELVGAIDCTGDACWRNPEHLAALVSEIVQCDLVREQRGLLRVRCLEVSKLGTRLVHPLPTWTQNMHAVTMMEAVNLSH